MVSVTPVAKNFPSVTKLTMFSLAIPGFSKKSKIPYCSEGFCVLTLTLVKMKSVTDARVILYHSFPSRRIRIPLWR